MSAERSGEVKICPYWRKWFRMGDHMLALCVAQSPDEKPLPNSEGIRLKECFLGNGVRVAFATPGILDVWERLLIVTNYRPQPPIWINWKTRAKELKSRV